MEKNLWQMPGARRRVTHCKVHVQPASWVDLMAPERCAMTWADWRQQFADQADALDFGRNDALSRKHGVAL